MSKLPLFPLTAAVNKFGRLVLGGCDTLSLIDEFGTPLYVFDEAGLRGKCTEFKREFGLRYAGTMVLYAAKAFLNKAMASLVKEEGLGLDVVSIGEIGIARSMGFPLERAYFHGNNKSPDEIRQALQWNIGHIVVDNFYELSLLDKIARELKLKPKILLRVTPGIDPHTHQYMSTGVVDSKFGFPLVNAEEAVAKAMAAANLDLVGLHFHLGSLIFEIEPYAEGVSIILDLAAQLRQKLGFQLKELDIGGGFAVQYVVEKAPPPISAYAEVITGKVISRCRELNLPLPQLIIEPGRSVVAQSGVALYTVGAVKEIPGVRCYVSVDGGMADNIRPALYGSRHEAVVATDMLAEASKTVTIAGKFCESGDILIKDIDLPPVKAGDIIAVPGCGAYCIPQSSNYNAFCKPPIVFVKDGKARLVRRRETLEDLLGCDVG